MTDLTTDMRPLRAEQTRHQQPARAPRCILSGVGVATTRRMSPCECCGNTYDKSFEISIGGTTHTFDSFECAIQTLAPRCLHCKCAIIGHGIEARGQYFCCAHCARRGGVTEVSDRAPDGGEAHP